MAAHPHRTLVKSLILDKTSGATDEKARQSPFPYFLQGIKLMKVAHLAVLALSSSLLSLTGPALAADTAPVAPTSAKPVTVAPGTAVPASPMQVQASTSVNVTTESMAEKWVQHKNEPWAQQQADEQKAKKERPLKKLFKSAKANLHEEMTDLHKDMQLWMSMDDNLQDPYDINKPPIDKPVIVMEMNLIDGSSGYVWRFPDDSFAIEGSYLDNTVLVPIKNENNEWIIKYPNGATGRVDKVGNTTTIYRPDKTTTTISQVGQGKAKEYRIENSKLGYMGDAHGDPSGVNYELGTWTQGGADLF